MESLFGTIRNINQLRTKADVVRYAIEFTSDLEGCCGKQEPNYEKAQVMIDFFMKNVSLPDTEVNALEQLTPLFKEILEMKKTLDKSE